MKNGLYNYVFTAIGILGITLGFNAPNALAAGHTYTCATEWSGSALAGAVTCVGNVLIFTTTGSQSAANNGTGNTIYDISNSGTGQTAYVSATVSSLSGTLKYGCYGDTSNCSFATLSSGTNSELPFTVPNQSSFAYLVFTNNGGGSSGSISDICVDFNGTDCTAGGGGGDGGGGSSSTTIATSTLDIEQIKLISTIGYNALVLFLAALMISIWMWRQFMR